MLSYYCAKILFTGAIVILPLKVFRPAIIRHHGFPLEQELNPICHNKVTLEKIQLVNLLSQ